MVVVPDAEAVLDEVADHRTGPDARLITSLHRAKFDDDRQRLALLVGELWCGTFSDPSPKPFDMIGVVPLEPPIHGTPRHPALSGDVGHLSLVDVRAYCAASAPFAEVILELRFENELVELL